MRLLAIRLSSKANYVFIIKARRLLTSVKISNFEIFWKKFDAAQGFSASSRAVERSPIFRQEKRLYLNRKNN